LADIYKYGYAILLVFKCFENGISKPMTLVNSGVLFAETELIFWDPCLRRRVIRYSEQEEFLQDFRDNR
jgi:hypothetical protein